MTVEKLQSRGLFRRILRLGVLPATKPADSRRRSDGCHAGFTGDAHICIKSQTKYASAVRAVLGAVCADTTLAQQDIDDMKLAVGEAVCNAIEHGSPNGHGDYICVSFAIGPEGLVAAISDGGGRLTRRSCKRRRESPALRERGYGLLLIQKLSSAVRIRSGKFGTTVTLEKRFPLTA